MQHTVSCAGHQQTVTNDANAMALPTPETSGEIILSRQHAPALTVLVLLRTAAESRPTMHQEHYSQSPCTRLQCQDDEVRYRGVMEP